MNTSKAELRKLTVIQLKQKLKELGARVKGNKEELIERIITWHENSLHRTIIEELEVPKPPADLWFPPDDAFIVPITVLDKTKLDNFTDEHIYAWFEKRMANKGRTLGKKMFVHSFLKDVYFLHRSKIIYVIARCAAQTKKDVDYKVKLVISVDLQDCGIKQAQCTCPAGAGWNAACKHVSALAHHLEHYGMTGENKVSSTCTGRLQTWHHPPARSGLQLKPTDVNSMLQKEIPQINMVHYPNVDDLLNTFAHHGVDSPLMRFRTANAYAYVCDHQYTQEFPVHLMDMRNKTSPDECVKIEKSTRKQSRSKLWKELRATRITASIAGSIVKTVRCGNYSEYIAVNHICQSPYLKLQKSITWGTTNEKIALRKYSEKSGNEIKQCGLYICPDAPYISATPDAITTDGSILVEVKCPYSCKDKKPTDTPYLRYCGGTYSLQRNHNYFFQVQLQMHATGTKHCDFVVWTTKGIFIESITYDKRFVERMLVALRSYYCQVFCPTYFKMLGS